MGISGSSIFTLFSILLFSVPCVASLSLHGSFIQCLSLYSLNSSEISRIVYTPNNSSYTPILQSSIRNLRFMSSSSLKPHFIVTPVQQSHVQAAVICSRKFGLQIRTRSGGHDFEGLSYLSDVPFIILDLFNMRLIRVNIKDESAWVQAGATTGELYYRIAAKSRIHGFPAGVCPTVCMGGFISGGGYGFMMRKYGLAADHVIDAYFVDVNGRILDRKSMGEDLFWAIRGGGGSSFGVILSWKIKLVRVPHTVTVFQVDKTLEQGATKIINRWQYIADKLPKDIFIRIFLQTVTSSQDGSRKTIKASFACLYLGDSKKLLKLMGESFPELGLHKKDCFEKSWLESILFHGGFTNGESFDVLLDRNQKSKSFFKRKSDYVKEPISITGLKGLWKAMLPLEAWPGLIFNPYGGRMSEISESTTPFPHRAGNLYKIEYAVNWNEEGKMAAKKHLDWINRVHTYLTPYVSKNPREAYLNYRDLDLGKNPKCGPIYEKARIWGAMYFKNNFNRLVKVKTKVDPYNFFRNQQSIPPFPSQKYWG